MKIAIAGATGFVGSHLLRKLVAEGHDIVALSRRDLSDQNTDQVQWKTCDLFSRLDLLESMKNCQAAFYLVHSMLPSARLTQGSFADYDLVLADNFARAARMLELQHIVYVSGIIPDDFQLSRHLLSRLEVERTLKASGVPVTTFRSGIVLGMEGSSFRMMVSLVHHLPVMICPSWTQTLSNPVYIDDLADAMALVISDASLQGKTYDVGGDTTLSYQDMMQKLAIKMKKKRYFLSVPFFSPTISRWWVALITGAPKALVYPLVGSLKTHMVPNVHRRIPSDKLRWRSFDQAMETIFNKPKTPDVQPRAFQYTGTGKEAEVRSIQRLETLYRFTAKEVAELYFQWLPKFCRPWVRVEAKDSEIQLFGWGMKKPLMTFVYSSKVSQEAHQVYYIRKGYLTHGRGRGRLSFRSIIDLRYTMVEIHEFQPSLPWYVYKYTQAILHLWVMRRFNRYLLSIKK